MLFRSVNRLLELFGLEELQEQEMPGGAPADTLGGQESGDRTWSGTEPGESTGAHGSAQSGQETCAGRKSSDLGDLEEILGSMCSYAYEKGIIEGDSVAYRDLFDTKIMGMLMPRPSEVIRKFRELYEKESPKAATDYYYKLSQDSDYIRRYRIVRDRKSVV